MRRNVAGKAKTNALEHVEQPVDPGIVAPLLHLLAGMGGRGAVATEHAANAVAAQAKRNMREVHRTLPRGRRTAAGGFFARRRRCWPRPLCLASGERAAA